MPNCKDTATFYWEKYLAYANYAIFFATIFYSKNIFRVNLTTVRTNKKEIVTLTNQSSQHDQDS